MSATVEDLVDDLVGENEDTPASDDESQEQGTPEDKDQQPPDDKDTGEQDAESEDDGKAAVLERAKEYGLSEEDINAFGDKAEEMVNRFAQMFDERVAALGRSLLEKESESEEGEQPKKPEEEAQAGSVAEKLKEAGYDDDLVAVVQALENEVTALKEQVMAPPEPDLDQVAQELGNFFANPPERFKAIVDDVLDGRSVFDLPEGSKEREFVNSVVQEIDALHAGYAAQGKQLSVNDLGERALAIVCKDKLKELSERELASKIKKRSDSALNEPARSGKDVKVPATREEEVKAVEELMREHGFIKQSLSDFLK